MLVPLASQANQSGLRDSTDPAPRLAIRVGIREHNRAALPGSFLPSGTDLPTPSAGPADLDVGFQRMTEPSSR